MTDRQTNGFAKPALSTGRRDLDKSGATSTDPLASRDEAVIDEIRKAIRSLRFGTVQVIVQDGRVVQIDKTEKIRLA